MFHYELSKGPSGYRRPAPLSDRTNIRVASTVTFVNVDPSPLNMPLNLRDRLIHVDNGENSLTFNSASSREDILLDDQFDKTNFDSICHTADIPSSLSIEINLDRASPRENNDDQLPNTSTDFHHATVSEAAKIFRITPTLISVLQIQSSTGALHFHGDLHDDFCSDTDTDIDSESPIAASVGILSSDSILPMTSTKKTIRAKAVCTNHVTIFV
jgi:hypothetical protein